MKTRLSLLLGLLIAVTPASVAAQTESPPPVAIDAGLVAELCAATAADDAELESCIGSVEASLAQLTQVETEEERTLLEQLAQTVDETLEDLRAVDLQRTFDDAIERAQEFDFDAALANAQQAVDQAITDAQTAIDELELPSDVDIQGAIEDAAAEALSTVEEFDFQAAVDDALAEAQGAIEEADLEGTVDDAVVALEGAVADAQATVAAAQAWAQENREAVCRGSSVSLGTTVGIAVFVATGIEWLGLQAFWAAERFTNAFCGDLVGE
jgi:flavin-binding protein dodecin